MQSPLKMVSNPKAVMLSQRAVTADCIVITREAEPQVLPFVIRRLFIQVYVVFSGVSLGWG